MHGKSAAFWLVPVAFVLLTLGLTATLDGQANPEADAPPSVEALGAMDEAERHRALRAMDRDARIAAVNALDPKQRRAYKSAGRSGAAPTVENSGYQSLSEPRRVEQPTGRVAGTTIQYDSGTVTGTFTACCVGRMVGNRYNSALNAAGTALVPVEQTGTITRVSFEMVRTFFSAVFWSAYSNVSGTQAAQVTSRSIPAAPGFNVHTVNPTVTDNVYRGGSFLAGIFQFVAASTAVGIDTNTNGGQGLNLVTIADPGTAMPNTGTGYRFVGGRNAIFRVGGNLVTPIELIDFEIE
ncbi:MAG: hypothetical protein AAGN66_21190 [Acidobacteriota bacterium]